MSTISDYMTRHHRDCDAAFGRAEERAATKDWTGLAHEANSVLAELDRHIVAEEELLFPAFEERTGMSGGGPTAVMRMEHEEMRGVMAQMRAAAGGRDGAQYLKASRALLELLETHNMKEENMMYPMLDRVLGEEAGALLDQVQAAMA